MEESDNKGVPPYRFNAKELDEETGLYYYGARYLDPTSVGWLSVDPLFEKYVGMSPYGYCAGNPVKLVDVDGRALVTSHYYLNQVGKNFLGNSINDIDKNKYGKRIHDYLNQPGIPEICIYAMTRKFFGDNVKKNREYITSKAETSTDGRYIYLLYDYNAQKKEYTPRWNSNTLFEEMFHSAQANYYDDCSNNLQLEVEAKLARAMFGFYGDSNGDKYIKDFAQRNKDLINKILKGEQLQKTESENWSKELLKFQEDVFRCYSKYKYPKMPKLRLNLLKEIINGSLKQKK